MEPTTTLLLLPYGAGALWVVVRWVARSDWFQKLLIRAWRNICATTPWRSVRREIRQLELKLGAKHDSIERQVESVAGRLAMLTARQELMVASHDLSVVVTTPDGHLTWASDSFLRLVRLPLSDVRGSAWVNAVHQEDRDKVCRAWDDSLRWKARFYYEYRYWDHETQCETWVEADVNPVLNPINERIAGYVGIVRKIKPPAWARPNYGRHDCPSGHWVPPLDRPDFGVSGNVSTSSPVPETDEDPADSGPIA